MNSGWGFASRQGKRISVSSTGPIWIIETNRFIPLKLTRRSTGKRAARIRQRGPYLVSFPTRNRLTLCAWTVLLPNRTTVPTFLRVSEDSRRRMRKVASPRSGRAISCPMTRGSMGCSFVWSMRFHHGTSRCRQWPEMAPTRRDAHTHLIHATLRQSVVG